MQTLGQTIEGFLQLQERQGQSKAVLTVLFGVLKKQLLWEVFSLLPQHGFPIDYEPVQVKVGKSTSTLLEYERQWNRFRAFLSSSTIRYLTMGDAVSTFLQVLRQEGLVEHTCQLTKSSMKLFGREYASDLSLSMIEGRIVAAILQQCQLRSGHFRMYIHRFLHHLQDAGHMQRLFKRVEPKWKREMNTLMVATHSLVSSSPFENCKGPYFFHCINAKNLTEQGLNAQYVNLTSFSRWLGSVSLESVDLDRVEHYLIYLQRERNYGLSSLKSVAAILKSLFSYLAQEGILSENRLTQLRVKQPLVQSRTVLTADELVLMLQAARGLDRRTNGGSTERIKTFLAARDIAILEVLSHTGIRSSELRQLTLNSVHWDRGILDISGKGSNRYYKQERRAFIEFGQTKQALSDYMAVRPAEFGTLLFTSKHGLPLKSGDLGRIITRCVKAAGIAKHITAHDLRATFASILSANGADPLTLKVLMGHENLSTTLKSYVSLEQEQLREVWKKCNPLANISPREEGVFD